MRRFFFRAGRVRTGRTKVPLSAGGGANGVRRQFQTGLPASDELQIDLSQQ